MAIMPKQRATFAPSLLIVACLLLTFGLTAGMAWRDKSATFDEPLHFAAAWLQTHYADFRCDPEDPPLWKYYAMLGTQKNQLKIPTSGLIWDQMLTDRGIEGLFFKQIFYYTPGNDAVDLLAQMRKRMLLVGMALGAVIAWWAWRLRGPVAAGVAAAAFCFDPNFLAHSPLLKADVPMSLALTFFMAAIWLVGRRATITRCVFLSIMFGAALTVKFSGILAVPLLGLSLLIRALLPESWPALRWNLHTRGRRLSFAAALTAGASIIAYVLIWACYRFRYGPAVDPSQSFDFAELLRVASKHQAFGTYDLLTLSADQWRQWQAHWHPDIFLRLGFWANVHHLFPQAWLQGLLFNYGMSKGYEAFLLGHSSMKGWWYYFPVAMAVKTPLSTLLALLLAAIYWILRRRSIVRWWNIFSLSLLPVLYMASAMTSSINMGIRHVLPIYPFIFIFLGITAADAIIAFRRPAMVVVGLFILGLAAETYTAYPDFIPFFNVAAGGWQNGPHLLGDSNLDWGQELPAIAEWQREHPQYQMYLNYFGSADPRYYQIHYVKLAGPENPEDELPDNSRPAIYAVSANASHFPWLTPAEKEFYRKLQSKPPITVLGHCFYLYGPP